MGDQDFTAEWLARANRLATVAAALSATVHEANNALQIISGSAEMLTAGTAGDVVVRRSETIGGQARRASALLAELSSFARDDPGEASAVTAVQRADVAPIAQRALAMRQYTLARLNIQGGFEAAGALPMGAMRPRDLLQIILNLLLNAERALTGRQDGRIFVRADMGDGFVRLTVDDNGPGLSEDARAHLFQPRHDAAFGQLGIGLCVARWLAEREGGTLVESPSTLGGCAFSLSLRSL